jgi:hypothetical protein
LHPPNENVAISHWPKIPNFAFADADTLPAPLLSDFDWLNAQPIAFAEPIGGAGRKARGGVPLPRAAPWPELSPLPIENAAATMPVPAPGVFEIPEKSFAVIAPRSRRAEQTAEGERGAKGRTRLTSADDGGSRRGIRGRRHAGRAGRSHASHIAGRKASRAAAHARHGPLKHLVQVKKRNV